MGRCIYLRKGEVHTAPTVGIQASDLPIGQIVKLMEGGVETEFIVVNQGLPDASLYDASCGGCWILRKDIFETTQVWSSSSVNRDYYANSMINTWLNGDYFNSLGVVEQSVIKQVKIPYINRGGSKGVVLSGESGLSTKAFLLGSTEVYGPDVTLGLIDGAKLDYFVEGRAGNSKRIAYRNGTAYDWWLRSVANYTTNRGALVVSTGDVGFNDVVNAWGARPALILPSTSIFDSTTYLLKG